MSVGDGDGAGVGRSGDDGAGDCDGGIFVAGMILIGDRGGMSVGDEEGRLRSATSSSFWAYGGRLGDE